jgi:hypothetical protein
MLKTSECVLINNKNRSYTDCMEWTLLRFMQILLCETTESNDSNDSNDSVYNYKINGLENNLLNIDLQLKNYMSKYPNIYKNTNYYMSDEGINERAEWCELLSDHDNLFDYYRTDKAELFTCVKNILIFYKHFFGLDLDLSNGSVDDQTNLDIIANYFSETTNKLIKLEIRTTEKENQKMSIDDMFMYLSKNDAEFNAQRELDKRNNKKNRYKVVNSHTYIVITVNDSKYLWTLYELYINDTNLNFNNKFITGHSVISLR